MTGPGCRQRPWTSAEVARLRALAGTMPAQAVAAKLGRSAASVEHMARKLGVSLAQAHPGEARCGSCGLMRSTVDSSGECRPCRIRARLGAVRERTGAAWAALPEGRRAVYAATEPEVGRSRQDPAPPPPDVAGMRPRARAAALSAWRRECEAVEAANELRKLKAAQRRLGRMRAGCVDSVKDEMSGGNA